MGRTIGRGSSGPEGRPEGGGEGRVFYFHDSEALNAGRRIGTPRAVDDAYMEVFCALHNIDLLLSSHA
jgi:hypothetical protein